MGLTSTSTGMSLFSDSSDTTKNKKADFLVALAGNPNVGKSTIFNNLTGMHQHTGNWPGKTVSNASGLYNFKKKNFLIYDIPGTYSLISGSEEEEIARDFICNEKPDVTVVVVDATCLERSLILVHQIMEITEKIIVCVNLLDEAENKGISINIDVLSKELGLPVVGTNATNKKTLHLLQEKIYMLCTGHIDTSPHLVTYNNKVDWQLAIVKRCAYVSDNAITYKKSNSTSLTRKIDTVLTSKKFGIPIMLAFLAVILWLTIVGSNYPSKYLSIFFTTIQSKLILWFNNMHIPDFITNPLIFGVYQTSSWVISVMLPPMAIFFPIFTILEDLGFLPRIAFNLDKCFKKCCTCGKQALTMCMGFGCNAAGVVGCRIIDTKKEKIVAMITNCFVPCNGRFPFLITISTIFIGSLFTGIYSSIAATITVLALVILGILVTLLVSKLLSRTILKNESVPFLLELPPYRKPQVRKIIVRSIFDRTLFVLGRAISVAAPAGIIIWILANVTINDSSLLSAIANVLDPFAKIMGLDGYILTAFFLGLPANEIVLPLILMSYMGNKTLTSMDDITSIAQILKDNGWTIVTAINTMIFCLIHFPCSTTLISIKKESGSAKWALLGFLIPTVCGVIICIFTNSIFKLTSML